MNSNAYEPAFPNPLIDNQGRIDKSIDYGLGGLTKREYFAAQIIQGMMANPAVIAASNTMSGKDGTNPAIILADMAITQDDILILQLEKPRN